eukprot:6200313-Pleurochrysis_carterae.AAC.1
MHRTGRRLRNTLGDKGRFDMLNINLSVIRAWIIYWERLKRTLNARLLLSCLESWSNCRRIRSDWTEIGEIRGDTEV